MQTYVHTSIDIEGDINLRNTLRCRGDTNKVEVTKQLVVPDELTFTLVDLDLNSSLTICRRRERLSLLRRDGRVPRDELGHDTTESLNTYDGI